MEATVESVNVGAPRPVEVNGHTILTAIWKEPVEGRVPLRGVNLRGDDQADRTVHGGPDKAVYAYAAEETEWWEAELGVALGPAPFGENLTTRGLPVSAAVIGEHWEVGSALLEVAQPRLPCFKLGVRMDDPLFPKRFAAEGRPGAYLRVVREGNIGAGDRIDVVIRPAHGVTSALVARAPARARPAAGRPGGAGATGRAACVDGGAGGGAPRPAGLVGRGGPAEARAAPGRPEAEGTVARASVGAPQDAPAAPGARRALVALPQR